MQQQQQNQNQYIGRLSVLANIKHNETKNGFI